jgi:hypothetical protein
METIPMEARQQSEAAPTPIQLSLRVRHPAIDPEEISRALGLEPEHCFKAGDSRVARSASRITGRHTQTYWLAPISAESWADPVEPVFSAGAVPKDPTGHFAVTAEDLQVASRNVSSRSVESLLLHFLQRLNARHAFLQRIQSEAGDVSLIMAIERESAADFTLPISVARLLVQLGISVEFRFDS